LALAAVIALTSADGFAAVVQVIVGMGVNVGVSVRVGVGVKVVVGVSVKVGVNVAVNVGVRVSVEVGVIVNVDVGIDVGTGAEISSCATNKSLNAVPDCSRTSPFEVTPTKLAGLLGS